MSDEESIEAEDNTPPPPEETPLEENSDELSLYDELLASDDFDEEDFGTFETETQTEIQEIGVDFTPEISIEDNAQLVEIGNTQTSSYRTNGTLDLEMKIGKYFKLSQLIYSGRCKSNGWPNIPGQDVRHKPKWTEEYIIRNLENLMVNVVDYIKEAYPGMTISSGYRAKKLNDSLGSSDASHHPQGCAVDLQFKNPRVNTSEVANWIIDNIPSYAQMIWEKPENGSGSWIHIAYQPGSSKKNQNDVYTGKEKILSYYGNRRRGSGKTKYMKIDRAYQNLV